MKISFVIPAHNEEALLPAMLRSVAAEVEAHPDIFFGQNAEVVVVDNASSDQTGAKARLFNFVVVVDEPKKGLVHARHAGFVSSKGELVANLDADVLVPKGWLKKVVEEFERDPKLVALSGPYVYHDLSVFYRALVYVFYFFGWVPYLFSHYVLGRGVLLQGGNFVIRRDAWERAGGFDTSIAFWGEDTDVAKRLSKHGKVKWTWFLPMYTSGRRLAGEGVMRTGWNYAINFIWVSLFGRPYSHEYRDIRQ